MKNTCALCSRTEFLPIISVFGGKQIGKCKHCGFVQVYPCVTSKEYAAFYADDWDHFAPYISQIPAHRAYFDMVLHSLRQYTTVKSPTLLDVGCALGVLLGQAKKLGMKAEGIDISKAAVKYGKKHGVSVYNETCASFYKKKQYHNRYDIVTALEVVEHEKNPVEMIHIIHTMLRANGVVVITTPNFNTLFRTLMGHAWIGYQHKEHLWFFTPNTIRRLLADAGFTNIQIRKDFARSYSVSYAIQRLGDYFPFLRPATSRIAPFFSAVSFPIPFNPWGDMRVVARK